MSCCRCLGGVETDFDRRCLSFLDCKLKVVVSYISREILLRLIEVAAVPMCPLPTGRGLDDHSAVD